MQAPHTRHGRLVRRDGDGDALLSLVKRLANIYTVDTDQVELIALVGEARKLVCKPDVSRSRVEEKDE